MTVAEQVGMNIRVLRTRKKLSQQGLADRLETDRHHLSDIELGKRNLSLSTLAKIAVALECELAELFVEVTLGK